MHIWQLFSLTEESFFSRATISWSAACLSKAAFTIVAVTKFIRQSSTINTVMTWNRRELLLWASESKLSVRFSSWDHSELLKKSIWINNENHPWDLVPARVFVEYKLAPTKQPKTRPNVLDYVHSGAIFACMADASVKKNKADFAPQSQW